MALNKLVREQFDDEGNTIYVMLSEEVDVRVAQTSGFVPTFTYSVKGVDVTDEIRKLRFSPTLPGDYIQNYEEFQKKIHAKEEKALAEMYEEFSLVPKNMSPSKQILWGAFVFLLISLPVFIVVYFK